MTKSKKQLKKEKVLSDEEIATRGLATINSFFKKPIMTQKENWQEEFDEKFYFTEELLVSGERRFALSFRMPQLKEYISNLLSQARRDEIERVEKAILSHLDGTIGIYNTERTKDYQETAILIKQDMVDLLTNLKNK